MISTTNLSQLETIPFVTVIFCIGMACCICAFALILVNSLWGVNKVRRSYMIWAASLQNREQQTLGSQAATKNRLVRELAEEVAWCRRESTFWHAAFGTFTLCHLCVTGGTALTALKAYATPLIMAGAGAVGVVATVGNGLFKPRVLAEQSLRRAEKLTIARRQAEADWDAISSGDSKASAKRQAVIGRLIACLNQKV
jgi:hypothetical protein